MTMYDLLAVPPDRIASIRVLADGLTAGMTVALSTHVNSDGDGCGSEAALSRLLAWLLASPHVDSRPARC